MEKIYLVENTDEWFEETYMVGAFESLEKAEEAILTFLKEQYPDYEVFENGLEYSLKGTKRRRILKITPVNFGVLGHIYSMGE